MILDAVKADFMPFGVGASDAPPLVLRMNDDIVDCRMVFTVAQRAGGTDESMAIQGETYDCAVLECSSDPISFASSHLRELE